MFSFSMLNNYSSLRPVLNKTIRVNATCPWQLGVMKQFWAILAHEVDLYSASIC